MNSLSRLKFLFTFGKIKLFMVKVIMFSTVLFMLAACGTQRQLKKAFVGEPVTVLHQQFGQPKTVIDKDQEKIYIFEKEKKLESTEINQGRLTLDPIVTPGVLKTERYWFTVKDGIVTKARYDEEYER